MSSSLLSSLKKSKNTLLTIRSPRHVLPALLAILTQKERYIPKLEWSSQSLIFNLFRVYEQTFGRRFGIRLESMTDGGWTNGAFSVYRYFYTVEAALVYAEIAFYEFLKSLAQLKLVKVYIPVLAPSGFGSFQNPSERPYLFAIAFELTTLGNTSTTTLSFSVTTSGSDRCLVSGVFDQGGQSTESGGGAGNVSGTGSTYASVTMSESQSGIGSSPTSNGAMHLFVLGNPASGANTYQCLRNTSRGDILDFRANVANYTGCSATGQPDSHNSSAPGGGTTTPYTVSTTVVLSNCWLVGYFNSPSGFTFSGGTGTTVRSGTPFRQVDSNATVGTGSQSLQVTWSGGADEMYAIVYSIAPVGGGAAAAVTVPTLLLLNVG